MILIAVHDDPWIFEQRPALVAHRGFAERYPENTLIALAAAVACGCKFLEFDVQLTGDGVPFLFHDDSLIRTTPRDGSIFDLSWAEISGVCVGEPQRFGPRFSDARPSTLAETVARLNEWEDVTAFVELKRQSLARYGVEDVVDQVWPVLADLAQPAVVISFVADAVAAARAAGASRVGWVIREWNDASRALAESLAPDFLFCNYTKIPDTDSLWPGPWRWVLYELATPEVAAHWRGRGCDLAESMNVGALMRSALYREPAVQ